MAKARPRVTFQHGKAFAYTPGKQRNYAQLAKIIAISQMNESGYVMIPKGKPVRILMEFYLNWPLKQKGGKPSQRTITSVPDITNRFSLTIVGFITYPLP